MPIWHQLSYGAQVRNNFSFSLKCIKKIWNAEFFGELESKNLFAYWHLDLLLLKFIDNLVKKIIHFI